MGSKACSNSMTVRAPKMVTWLDNDAVNQCGKLPLCVYRCKRSFRERLVTSFINVSLQFTRAPPIHGFAKELS